MIIGKDSQLTVRTIADMVYIIHDELSQHIDDEELLMDLTLMTLQCMQANID